MSSPKEELSLSNAVKYALYTYMLPLKIDSDIRIVDTSSISYMRKRQWRGVWPEAEGFP